MDPNTIKKNLDDMFGSLDKGSQVALLVQPSPDPDCLGAAAGFGLLLKEVYGLAGVIHHLGEVSHPQNKSMVNVLRMHLQKGELNPAAYTAFAVLDTDLTGTGFKSKQVPKAQIRIDHHDMDRDEFVLNDVRNVGSACSIVWEYLTIFKIPIEEHPDVATAMVLGIKTDTGDFSSPNTAELDFEAFRHLIPMVDKESLAKINNYPIPKAVLEAEATALSSMHERGSVVVASVGILNAHKRDIIPIIADRFIRLDNVNTVVILGIVDNHLLASVRSTDSRHNVSDLCAEVFGTEFSGAKNGSGGARAPLGLAGAMTKDDKAREAMNEEITHNIAQTVFEVLGEN